MLALRDIRALHSRKNARTTLNPRLAFSGKMLALRQILAVNSRSKCVHYDKSVPCILGKMLARRAIRALRSQANAWIGIKKAHPYTGKYRFCRKPIVGNLHFITMNFRMKVSFIITPVVR